MTRVRDFAPHSVEDSNTADLTDTAPGSTAPASGAQTPAQNESPSAEIKRNPSRHVQWPAEISSHISIPMRSNPTSPTRTLQDQGAEDALQRALEAHSSREDGDSVDLPRRYVGHSASEPHSTAASSDGDHEERMEQMKDKMEVYVDPNETDGLPTIGKTGGKGRANRAAWSLVRGYTTGGTLRRRGTTKSKAGPSDEKGATTETEKAEGGAGGFSVHNPFRAHNDISSTEPPHATGPPPAAAPGGGILAALIALQQQQADAGSMSATTSGANTPSSFDARSRASSIHDDFSDSDEEEAERLKFLARQRQKREHKNFVHSTSNAVSGAGKGIGKGIGKVAVGSAGAAGAMIGGAGNALGLKPAGAKAQGRSRSGSEEVSGSTSPKRGTYSSSPTSPRFPVGAPELKKKRGGSHFDLTKLGNKFGLDSEDRPDAAKNGAGVFGALATSTVSVYIPIQPLHNYAQDTDHRLCVGQHCRGCRASFDVFGSSTRSTRLSPLAVFCSDRSYRNKCR